MNQHLKHYLKIAFVVVVILGLVMSYVWNPYKNPPAQTAPQTFSGPTSAPQATGPTTPPSQTGPLGQPPLE